MTDLLLPAPKSDTADAQPAEATPAPAVGWQTVTLANLSEVEDLLDSLEAHGVAEREVVSLQNNLFAVRWR